MSAHLSVIVCTYNRCESLRQTMQSLIKQQVADDLAFEIIVVDNNSTDETRQTVEVFTQASAGKVRYLFESQQGLGFARNTGIRAASGSVVAFIDDDVLVEPDWVQAVWRCFKETSANALGGKVNALWQCERPQWFSEELRGPLIAQDLGPQRKHLTPAQRSLLGANMAFRREVFERFGSFQPELGRRGNRLIGGEDAEIFSRLFKAGCAIYYEPAAIVWHKIDAQRLSKSYLRRWYQDIGATIGHQMPLQWHNRLTVAPLWVWQEAVRSLLRYLVARLRPQVSQAERFASSMWVRFHIGLLRERFSHWRQDVLGFGRGSCLFSKG